MVSVTFPVNSNTIGAPLTMGVCLWDARKPFAEFWTEMCKNMQLPDQAAAVLGYKFSTDRVKDAARQMSTAEDYTLAMEELLAKVRSARTKEHKLVLHNLVGVHFST